MEVGRMDLDEWNKQGRATNQAVCAALAGAIEEGHDCDIDLTEDNRSEALANAVLKEVVAENDKGTWQNARRRFDPAHGPFVPHMEATESEGFGAVSILGADSFLVRRDDTTLHMDGDSIAPLEGVHGFARSRDRRWLALACDGFIEVRPSLHAPADFKLPWPGGEPFSPQSFEIANDGQTMLISEVSDGIWVSQNGEWIDLVDRIRSDGSDDLDEDDDPHHLHGALSPDGKLIAYGWQDSPGHYVERLTSGQIERVGMLEAVESVQMAARFTDDSLRVLSNTLADMYKGVTVAPLVESLLGKEAYDDLPEGTPRVDELLPAYALTSLPGSVLGLGDAIAWICGAGWCHGRLLRGEDKPAFTQMFGSSLCGVDYDPHSGRAVVASSSGYLHVLDPAQEATTGTQRGYRPRQELYRWVWWDTLEKPIRW